MKAIELQHAFGIESLQIVDRPEPSPGPGEVLIHMQAVSLNFRDLLLIRGVLNPTQSLPLIPLSDGVGTVVAVGEAVSRVHMGDRVAGIFVQNWLAGALTSGMMTSTLGGPRNGMAQEYVVLPETGVVVIPDHLTDEEGATLPIAGVTAWHAVVSEGEGKPGEVVLIQGTGGVSLFALQFARLLGVQTIVTSRSDEKLNRVRALGATRGINTRAGDWAEEVMQLTDGQGVDHVLDIGGASTLAASLRVVRPGGRISVIGGVGGTQVTLDLSWMQNKNARLQGIQTGSRAMFEAMNRAIALHRLRPTIDRVFAFEDVQAALRYLEQGGTFGKVCLRL